ncbi:hypothetical protein FK220_000865 [Flavobacteriaceae bacterium TP-CH-4]|uniref:Uncharacterized protein n=1 Tax=Pelagihabitans pacificus TaxID=2696054 RepID=A0A967E3Z6_9FLAO|nr:hypothetical protein [Pelagihabitans pacificus]NHF57872.1 hypothetical protein [Pelagihabitans pacificus]
MNFNTFKLILFFCFLPLMGWAQDCTLDVGGENFNAITEIFQLNTEQKATMETLRGELLVTNKAFEDEIQKLFDQHPQSTEEDLITLANKYKVLQQKMVDASWETDKILLSTFNPKQYQLYLDLCMEALRKPIKIIPVSYKDSIAPE